jgi:hypothetical protein
MRMTANAECTIAIDRSRPMKTVDNFMNAAPPRSIREDSLYFGHRVCAIRIDAHKEVARAVGYWIRCNNVPDAVENMGRMPPLDGYAALSC